MTQASEIRGANICTSKAGLVAGTTSTVTTAGDVNGSIAGKFADVYSADSNTVSETTQGDGSAFVAVGASQMSVFVFCIDAAGAVNMFQGAVEDLDEGDAVMIPPQFPDIDESLYLAFGYAIVIADSTASAWTFGASSWTATGIADTFTDVTTMPLRPQAA